VKAWWREASSGLAGSDVRTLEAKGARNLDLQAPRPLGS
jgi:hypothetical protein